METKKLFLAAFALALAATVQAQPTGTFKLKISNVKNPSATIHVGFYKEGNEFPTQGKHAFAKQFIPSKTGEITISWDQIPQGEYALAIYQDLNGSEKMEANMFGYPKEPFAFSNNVRPKMAKPKFTACAVKFDEKNSSFEVALID
ncbi:MAG: DUF2141 domain-containing protein [Bacteroidota bacterium]|jgi:uncharacterized protein (DUF2141 family)|nr:DUF2141 domain-containing protein [Cytophagales bacterium]MCE2955616.1 DUF2141 domain-containing protein [Flammeovirgaceae bacterium]MCZ8071998.1 DUF2141 domain-containing protein [Cytophagales bacterium]